MNTEVGVETFTFFTPLKPNGERMDWIEAMEEIADRVRDNSTSSLPISDAVRSFYQDFDFSPQSGHEFVWWLQEFERAHSGIDIVEQMRKALDGPQTSFKLKRNWNEPEQPSAD